MVGWAWCVWAALAAPVGWRGDGTDVYASAPPTLSLNPEAARWKTPMPAFSGASVVVGGGKIITTAEPTTLMAIDAATGQVAWQLSQDWIDAVPPDRKSAAWETLQAGERALAELTKVQGEYSALQREARRGGGDPAALAKLEALSARMGALRDEADKITSYRTPPRDILGWANPTPVLDGGTVYAVFSNGVVTAVGLDGTRRWITWLGPQTWTMRGWHEGSTASPLLVDGTLVVPYGAVHGLDPATGKLRWSSGVYHDFGTPTVATVAGRRYLVTPDGRAIDPRTGAVAATGLGDVWYSGPTAAGDVVVFFGGLQDDVTSSQGGVTARAVQLRPSGAGLAATTLWSTHVPGIDRYYAAPVIHRGLIYQLSKRRTLVVLDAATGALVYQQSLDDHIDGGTWTNPAVVGGHLFVLTLAGETLFVPLGRTFSVAGQGVLEHAGGQVGWSGGRAWVRGEKFLWGF
jgi:outer membrane protein assembly factor BamB